MDKKIFFKLCENEFQFLENKFGFKRKSREASANWFQITYKNETTAVKLIFDWREQYIFVDICRLKEGKLVENPIVIRQDSEINCFNLYDLLSIRNPRLNFKSSTWFRSLSLAEIKRIIEKYAYALEHNAQELLQGDFGVLPEIEKIIKSRIKS